MELLIIFVRTVLIYGFIFFMMRLMGKREIGKLSIFDLVISVMIAEIAVFVIEDPKKPLFFGLLPMLVLVAIQILLAFAELKSPWIRNMMEGRPSILVRNGVPDAREMKRQRYNMDDLLQQLREKDVASVADVEFAILENSGKLSVFKKSADVAKNRTPKPPLPLVIDGQIQLENLREMDIDEAQVKHLLRTHNVVDVRQVLYAALDERDSETIIIHLKRRE